MKPGVQLMKDLARASAEVLHNTHVAPRRTEFKFELIEKAYGRAQVVEDFKVWCLEQVQPPQYPITDYMQVVDNRLGHVPKQARGDTSDPQVLEICTLAFELTGIIAPASAIADLLLAYPAEEIKGALKEYTATLTEKEAKVAMRQFYSENGAAAVILARRNRRK